MKTKRIVFSALCAFTFGLAFAVNSYAQTSTTDCITSCMVACAGSSTDPKVIALCAFDCPYYCAGGSD